MPTITAEWDRSLISVLRSPGLERALVRVTRAAGGDAIRAARVASSRRVRERKSIRVSRVSRALVLSYPRSARSLDDLVWIERVSSAMTPIAGLPKRQTRRGVNFSINKGKRSLIPGAFVQKMRSGHVGVFHRTGEKIGLKGGRRPFTELFSSRVIDVFRDDGMPATVLSRAQSVFAATFSRLLPLEIAKAK